MGGVSTISMGDIFGFAALFLIAITAAMMLLRSRLLKMTKNIGLIRSFHLVFATLAGLFLALHISSLYLPPVSTGVTLGYVAVIASVVAWLTGTAFLQKVKDSLFFHGVLSSILIPLSLMHAATASTNIPAYWAEVLLGGSAAVVTANAALHLIRAKGSLPRH